MDGSLPVGPLSPGQVGPQCLLALCCDLILAWVVGTFL